MSEIGAEAMKANGGQLNGGDQRSTKPEVILRRSETSKSPAGNPVLGLHASAKLRERLIVEIRELTSPEDAPNGPSKASPKRTNSEQQMRSMSKQVSKQNWLI